MQSIFIDNNVGSIPDHFIFLSPSLSSFCEVVYTSAIVDQLSITMPQDYHVALVCALSRWIEEHLGRVIHLEELAAYSGYSLWHMQKLFKETTGISLGKYIRQRRLTSAVNLLRYSKKSIFDIALDFGFGSQSHFTYMFRKEYGITPYDFRQNPNITLEVKTPLHLSYEKM